jgi:F-type H+-transporting ATPase subunit b
MLEIHPQLLLYQGVIFLVFVFLMWKFVYKNLMKMVEDRRQRIENTIMETERKRGEAEALRVGYETRIADIRAQADEAVRKAEAEGWRRHEEIVEAGRTEARRLGEQAQRRTEAEIEEAFLAAKGELVGIASDLARKALGKSATPDMDARLVRELSEELKEWKR